MTVQVVSVDGRSPASALSSTPSGDSDVGSGYQTERIEPSPAFVARPAAEIEVSLTPEESSGWWYLARVTSELLRTTEWLVEIPSPTGEEAAIRDAIAARLAHLPRANIEDSLVVGKPGPGMVILAGHLDTVPLRGIVGSRVSDGRLHGLGATDMKSGLAVMVHLLEALGTDGVVGVFYAGEEGPLSANQLGPVLDRFPALTEAAAGIVLEPTNRELQAGCNGAINATVSFLGEPAHSARPWLGVNAITRAGAFLHKMDSVQPESHVLDGLEFLEVMSVTKAVGGVANNVIPGRFDLNVNYRFAPDRSLEAAIVFLEGVSADADEFEVTDAAPAAAPDVSHELFAALAETAGAEVTPKQGWTDVAQLVSRGVPAVNFGPGETDLAHKPGESVRIDDLAWAYDALLQVLSDQR